MEDFIDYILFLLLIFVIAFACLIIFLLVKNPIAGYLLIFLFIFSITGGTGILGWKFYQKKRLGPYYEILREISQSRKEIHHSTRQLERHLKKAIKEQFPKIHQLCHEAQKCIYKITEIDKVISSLEKKQVIGNRQTIRQIAENNEIEEKIQESNKRHQENIRAIKVSKNQYFQKVQQVLKFLQELNSQILALKYSHGNIEIQAEIAETIDGLLIEIQTLKEMTT